MIPSVLEMMNWLMTSTLSGVAVGRPVEDGELPLGAGDSRGVGRGVFNRLGAKVVAEDGVAVGCEVVAVVGFGVTIGVGFGVSAVVGCGVDTGVDEGDSEIEKVGAGVTGFCVGFLVGGRLFGCEGDMDVGIGDLDCCGALVGVSRESATLIA